MMHPFTPSLIRNLQYAMLKTWADYLTQHTLYPGQDQGVLFDDI